MKISTYQQVACLLPLFLSVQAYSQSSQSNQTEALNELIVTAGISPIESDQFGGSITVITAAQLAASKAMYLSEVLRHVPGFAVNQSGGPGTQTQIRIRGSEANHVLVLLDGVRVNDPTANDEFLANYALLNNVERIEVIRGPQSAIWGTDAMSAVINIITRNSAHNQLGFDVELGSFDSKRLSMMGGFVEEIWQLDAGINALDTAGTNISRLGAEHDGFENLSSHLKLKVDVTDKINMSVSLSQNEAKNEYDGTDFVVTGLPVDADLWTKRSQDTAHVVMTHHPNQRWYNELQYQWTDIDAKNFQFGLGETSSTAAETNEFKINSTVRMGRNSQHRLSFAVDHREVDFIQRGESSPFGNPNQNQSYHVLGLATEYHNQLTEKFSWNVSARNDDFSQFDDVSNYKLAASYQLNDDWRLRGSLGTGSKAPSFIERFGFYPANFVGNPNLKPEHSDAFELALEKTWANHNFEIIYFNQDLQDEINGFVFDVDSGLFTAANQAGESHRQGVELNWSGQIKPSLNVGVNYTYTDATEEDLTGQDTNEVRRPKNMANINLDYRFASHRGQLYAQVKYQDDQWDVFYDPSTYISSQLKLQGYTTFDLTFSWQINPTFEFYAKGFNLFDESYEEILGYARPGAHFSTGVKAQF